MANKLANLQNALNNSTGKGAPPLAAVERQPSPVVTKLVSTKATSRANQANISAWLHKDFKKSIRLVQAKKAENAALQDLMAEAFNELFAKYNVPTVNAD